MKLDDLVKKKSKFLNLKIGEEGIFTYKGYQIVPSQFNPDEEIVRYELIDEDGRTKYWTNGSIKVMQAFMEIPLNSKIKIKRLPKLSLQGKIIPNLSQWIVEMIPAIPPVKEPFEEEIKNLNNFKKNRKKS